MLDIVQLVAVTGTAVWFLHKTIAKIQWTQKETNRRLSRNCKLTARIARKCGLDTSEIDTELNREI